MFCGEIFTEGKKLFRLPSPDVPTKNGAVNVTAFAPAPDAITDDCSVQDGIDAVYPACCKFIFCAVSAVSKVILN